MGGEKPHPGASFPTDPSRYTHYREYTTARELRPIQTKDVTNSPPVEDTPISAGASEAPHARAGPTHTHQPTTTATYQPGHKAPGPTQSPNPEAEHPQNPKPPSRPRGS